MRRRDFVRAFAGLSAAWPLLARAQQRGPTRRVGILWYTGTDRPTLDRWMAALRQGLEQLGWSEGHNLLIDMRYAAFEQLRQSAKDLVAGNPDVLIAGSTPALAALRPATSTIPIVFAQVTDPIGQGFVASLANPAGNITGFMNFESAMAGKWVEILLEISPNLAGITVISNSKENPQTEYYIPSIEAAAKERSLQTLIARVQNDAEFDRAVAALQNKAHFGMVVPPGPITSKIIDAMARMQLNLSFRSHPAIHAELDQPIQQRLRRCFQGIGLKKQSRPSIGAQTNLPRDFRSVFGNPFLHNPQRQ